MFKNFLHSYNDLVNWITVVNTKIKYDGFHPVCNISKSLYIFLVYNDLLDSLEFDVHVGPFMFSPVNPYFVYANQE